MKTVKCNKCGWKGGADNDFKGTIICPKCFCEIKVDAEKEEVKSKTKRR